MTYNASWLLLIVAGFLEIFFAVGLKSANGLERPWLLVGTVVVLAGSLSLLTMALRVLPVGTALRSGPASALPAQPFHRHRIQDSLVCGLLPPGRWQTRGWHR